MGLLSTRSLGVSIRDGHATFAEVEKVAGRIRVLRSGAFPLDGSPAATGARPSTSGGPELYPEGLPSWQRPEEVVVGMSRGSLVLRFLDLPDVEESHLGGLLAYELERHLPFPPEEAWYSFQKLRRSGDRAQILLVAARRTDVERSLNALERCGLHPTHVDVSSLAATNALLYCQPKSERGVRSLIELNGRDAVVSVVKEGRLVSSRLISLNGDSLDPVRLELERAAQVIPGAPGTIHESEADADLCLLFQKGLGLPVEPWSPTLSRLDASAFGLALKGLVKLPIQIDLLPAERRRKRRERVVLVMFALLGLVGTLGAAWALSDAYLERRILRQLDQQLAEVKAEAAAVASVKAEWAKLRANLELLGGLAGDRETPLLVLKELVALLPSDAVLTEFSLEGNSVRIRGSTSSSASDLITAFERSSLFENAAFTSPIAAQGKDRQGFQIEAFVKGRSAIVDRGPRPGARR